MHMYLPKHLDIATENEDEISYWGSEKTYGNGCGTVSVWLEKWPEIYVVLEKCCKVESFDGTARKSEEQVQL